MTEIHFGSGSSLTSHWKFREDYFLTSNLMSEVQTCQFNFKILSNSVMFMCLCYDTSMPDIKLVILVEINKFLN